MNVLQQDLVRYKAPGEKMPKFQKYFRRYQMSKGAVKQFYRVLYRFSQKKNLVEIPRDVMVGPGLHIGHPYLITINREAIIGKNCNIHRGVTIGQENRGERRGVPTIGDCVWIGINATIVGKITIGDDVLIAPNSYVNRDIPSHSVVLGNPCIVVARENATEYYINNTI